MPALQSPTERTAAVSDMSCQDPAIDLSNRRLVFLVGAPRSGTTWLQLMLASSEHVATENETHLFSHFLVSQFAAWDRFKRNAREIGLYQLMDEAEFLTLIRHFADAVISRILANKPEARVILEKTPDHVHNWRQILKIYPDACFLIIVRDPRAVVASMRAASQGWGRDWAPFSLRDNCEQWAAYVNEGQQIKEATSNVIEVRYEDLKSDCATELRQVFAWMGVDLSFNECSQIAERNRIDHLRSGNFEGAPWELSKEPKEFYRRGEIDGWRDDLTPMQVYRIESMTRDLMDAYRYARVAPSWNIRSKFIAARSIERVRTSLQWRLRRIADALSPRL